MSNINKLSGENLFSKYVGKFDPKLFWPIAIIYFIILAATLIDGERINGIFGVFQNWFLANFSWFVLISGSSTVICIIWLIFGSKSKIVLGGEDAKPEYSLYSWITMLFCASFGAGFVIFGPVEPLYNLFNGLNLIDDGTAGKSQGIPEAMRLTLISWGVSSWPLFAVGGWAVGYAAYKYNKPLRTSTGIYGLLGEKCNTSFIGKFIDIVGSIGSIGGVAMMIGVSVASICYGLEILFEIKIGTFGKFVIMLGLIAMYIISTSTGLSRGMRYLSESTGYIAIILLFVVLIFGSAPFTYIISIFMQTAGEFILRIPQMLTYMDAGQFEARSWHGVYFIFYILWCVSFVPFCAIFLAKISKGRTAFEYALGTTIIPLSIMLFWFCSWGGNTSYEELNGTMQFYEAVKQTPEKVIYLLLGQYPMGSLWSILTVVAMCLFAVTTADACSYCVAQQVLTSSEEPKIALRVFWGCIIGFTGILFQTIGGINALRSMTIVTSALFIVINILYVASIFRMMSDNKNIKQ